MVPATIAESPPYLSPSLPLARDVRQRAHRRATRPDAASIARLVSRAFSLPQREAPPLWETPRAATGVKAPRPSLPLAREPAPAGAPASDSAKGPRSLAWSLAALSLPQREAPRTSASLRSASRGASLLPRLLREATRTAKRGKRNSSRCDPRERGEEGTRGGGSRCGVRPRTRRLRSGGRR